MIQPVIDSFTDFILNVGPRVLYSAHRPSGPTRTRLAAEPRATGTASGSPPSTPATTGPTGTLSEARCTPRVEPARSAVQQSPALPSSPGSVFPPPPTLLSPAVLLS